MPPTRDPYFDNARFLLVALVVAGHAIEPLIEEARWLKAGFLLVYAFHVPAIAFVAGHFSRASLGTREFAGLCRSVLAPYAVFQALYVLFRELVLGQDGTIFLRPYWLMWFLLSLACWKLLLPLALRLRAPLLLAIAAGLGIGALVDAEGGYTLSVSRTLVFFPFFLAGHLIRGELLDRLASPLGRWLGLALLLVGSALAWWLAPALFPGWLYGAQPYASLGATAASGVAIRAGVYLAGFGLGASFLALVPRRATFFTAWGSRSLQAYLLHGFVVKGLVAAGAYAWLGAHANAAIVAGAGLLLAAGLSTRAVELVAGPLVRPRLGWLLGRKGASPPVAPAPGG